MQAGNPMNEMATGATKLMVTPSSVTCPGTAWTP